MRNEGLLVWLYRVDRSIYPFPEVVVVGVVVGVVVVDMRGTLVGAVGRKIETKKQDTK